MFDRYLEVITEKGLKSVDVANGAHVPASTFSDWKKGKSKPKSEKMKKIADFLGVNPDWLAGISDQKYLPAPSIAPEDHSGKKAYYLDPEAAEMAQELFENPDMRVLFDAARDITPDQLKAVGNMVEAMRKKEEGDFDEPC